MPLDSSGSQFDAGLQLAGDLVNLVEKVWQNVDEINRLREIANKGYTENGRNRRGVDQDAYAAAIRSLQLQNQAWQSDIGNIRDRLDHEHSSTVVPGTAWWTYGEQLMYEEGGVGPEALIDRALFNSLPLTGPAGLEPAYPEDIILLGGAIARQALRKGFKGFAKPYAGSATEVVAPRVLKPNTQVIRGIRALPDGARLTAEQISELGKNIDLLLQKTLPAKALRGRAKDVVEIFNKDPRFRVPGSGTGWQGKNK